MDLQRNIKAILFDFDGTLVDLPTDYVSIKREINEQIEKFGITPKCTLTDSISILAEARAKKFKTITSNEQKKVYKIIDKWELQAVASSTPVEGSRKMLEKLKSVGIKIAIVSRNCKEAIVSALKLHGFPEVDVILSRDDVENMKPHPKHGLKAIRLLGVTKSECLIVGDSWHDLRMGRELDVETYILQRNEKMEIAKENKINFMEKLIDILKII